MFPLRPSQTSFRRRLGDISGLKHTVMGWPFSIIFDENVFFALIFYVDGAFAATEVSLLHDLQPGYRDGILVLTPVNRVKA